MTSNKEGYEPPVFDTEKDIIGDDLKLTTLDVNNIALEAVSMYADNNKLSLTVVLDPQDPTKLIVVEEKDSRLSDSEQQKIDNQIAKVTEEKAIFSENYQTRTLHEFGLSREALLKAAKDSFNRFGETGLKGSFTTFGDYNLQPAQTVNIIDPRNPDKNGEYIIKDVEKTFGSGGYRMSVDIPNKFK